LLERKCFVARPEIHQRDIIASSSAVGGASLEGRNLVRLAYLDEAGIGNIANEPILTVGGVIVNADSQLDAIEDEIERITKRRVPEHEREEFCFHAADIYGGNGRFDKGRHPYWTEERRFALFEDFVSIPKRICLPVVTSHVDRRKFPEVVDPSQIKGDLTVAAHVSAYVSTLISIDLWVRKYRKNEYCMVIVEDNERARQNMKEMHRAFQQKSVEKLLSEEDKNYLPFRRIREDPTFQPNRPGHPLAVADMVSFVLKRELTNDPWISTYWHLLIPHLVIRQLQEHKGWK
jgi:hypothetical protein